MNKLLTLILFSILSFNIFAAPTETNNNAYSITILGDSTIDNRVWVFPGLIGNFVLDHLGLSKPLTYLRNWMGSPKSVVEHLRYSMPNYVIHDYSNDGFTTTDCLGSSDNGKGAYKDKVFPSFSIAGLHFGFFPDLFPHQRFKPLESALNDLKNSNFIILSIGGNNFREFLVRAHKINSADDRKQFIHDNFEKVFVTMQKEYAAIYSQIRAINKDAKIILMTQYYPSTIQNFYQIYPFMHELGVVMNMGGKYHDGQDVIQEIMRKTYKDIFQKIDSKNVVVADITSSLNPNENGQHIRQIEPSAMGAKKIAEMLKAIVLNSKRSGVIYSFSPEFFADSGYSEKYMHVTNLNNWNPKHPKAFDA